MAGVTPKGIRFPDGNDPIDPAGDMEKLAYTADAAITAIPGAPDLSGINAEINGLKTRMASVENGNIPNITNALGEKLNARYPQLVVGNLSVFGDIGGVDVSGSRLRSTAPGSSTSSANVRITADGWIQAISSSSRRYKTNIGQVFTEQNDPRSLLRLPVVTFDFIDPPDDAADGIQQVGFLAEDMADVYPIGAESNQDGEPESWNDRTVIPALLALIQELHGRVSALEGAAAE